MRSFLFVISVVVAAASPDCKTFDGHCGKCTHAATWIGFGQHCRYCPKDNKCHAAWSLMNPCSSGQCIYDEDKCPSPPTPAPTPAPAPQPTPPPPTDNGFAVGILDFVLKHLGITDVNTATCVRDVSGAKMSFVDFAHDMQSKQYKTAVTDLSRGISSLSNAVGDCGLQEVQQKLDTLAASIHWANISTSAFDKTVKILVGASDLWQDLEELAAAVLSKDTTDVGEKLTKLMSDWTAITGGCSADDKTCTLLDGLMRVLAVSLEQVAPCERALMPAVSSVSAGASAFKQHNYQTAIADFATGLDDVAKALESDSCGLKKVGAAISLLSPKLAKAIVKIEGSKAVQVLIGSSEVYDELYALAVDVEKGDWTGAGMQMGALLSKLRASGCQSKACIVLEGILASFQIEFADLTICEADIDAVETAVQSLTSDLKKRDWKQGLLALGNVLKGMGDSVNGCGMPQVGAALQQVAEKLHADGAATIIGTVVRVLVEGADITPDLQKMIVDAESGNWAGLGQDLGQFSSWMSTTGCNSFVCHLVEGILQEAGMVLTDLKPCEAKLRETEGLFSHAVSSWKEKHHGEAVKFFASALNDVAQSVDACGLAEDLSYIQQEANVLGLGNITAIGEVVSVLVHGSNFYESFYQALLDFEKHDYRSAGQELGHVMNDLSQWTTGHLCTSPVCYIVNGMMQYLGDLQSDIKSCKRDFQEVWGNMSSAYHDMTDSGRQGFRFSHDVSRIKRGVKDLGMGLMSFSHSMTDCHMAELAMIIEQLAVKLGIVPEVAWVEDLIKILIEGIPIEQDVANACENWADNNWPGVGFNLIKLIKDLVHVLELPATDAKIIV